MTFKRDWPNLWDMPLQYRQLIWAASKYTPSKEQLAFHMDSSRFKQGAGGERAGKSRMTAEEAFCWAVQCIRGDLIWFVGEKYEHARQEFRYLLSDLAALGILDVKASISMPAVGPWSCYTVAGTQIVTKSANDPNDLASVPPMGVVMCEAALQSYDAYLRCRGRVAEKRGPLVLSGTFSSARGWYADLWRAWQRPDNVDGGRSFSIPTWSNLAIFPGGREDPEIESLKRTYPHDTFMERFGAIPSSPARLVFREFEPSLHISSKATYDPIYPVQLWIDPGYDNPYVVLAVQLAQPTTREGGGTEVWVIDEIYQQGMVAEKIIATCKERSWWPSVKVLVMDKAGKAHPGSASQAEIWYSLTGKRVVMNSVGIVDGILRHRTFLINPATGKPRLLHNPKCRGTIAEYDHYVYATDYEGRPSTELPLDSDNHGLKAIAYGLISNYGAVSRRHQRVTFSYE